MQLKFTVSDIVNLDEAMSYVPLNGKPSYNPYNVHPHILHVQEHVICVVWASHLQDPLDIAVDRLDHYRIPETDYEDYDVCGENPTCTFLGNAGVPYDISTLEVLEISNHQFFAQIAAIEFIA